MAQRDFRDRLSRIGVEKEPLVEVQQQPRAPLPIARLFWGLIGVVWGLAVFTFIPFIDENYDAMKVEIDAGSDVGKAMLGLFAFAIISLLLYCLMFLIGLIFLRKKMGFWMLMLGFWFGSALAATSLKMTSILPKITGTG